MPWTPPDKRSPETDDVVMNFARAFNTRCPRPGNERTGYRASHGQPAKTLIFQKDDSVRKSHCRNRPAGSMGLASLLDKGSRERGLKGRHVQAHPDRQPRRNRLPDHQDRAPDGHRDGRGLFRSRPRRPACRDGRRGGADRPAAGGAELSARSTRSSRPARRPAPRPCIRATASCPSARRFRWRLRRPASSSSGPTPRPSPRWATRSSPRRRRPRPRFRPCPAISASSRTTRRR